MARERAKHYQGETFEAWRRALESFTPDRRERLEGAYFGRAGPETLLYDEIEALWTQIANHDDWSDFEAKLEGLEAARLAYR